METNNTLQTFRKDILKMLFVFVWDSKKEIINFDVTLELWNMVLLYRIYAVCSTHIKDSRQNVVFVSPL